MSESAVGTEAVRQYEAHGAMPASLMDSANGRAWLDTQTMQINEPLLAAVVIDQYGLTRTGRQVTDENGQIVTPSTIKRYLSEEIGAFFPVNTSRLVASAYKTLIDRIPEKSRAGGLKIISAADLQQATLEPPAFVVDTLLPCGLCVLAAPPKTGKSWLCLALADAVAKGEPFPPEHRWDVSRVAAQVVSGIGFIGAGTIIFHKSENVVRGLTTAAGLWVTAAIGLACGGGMYILSIASTILVLVGLEAFNFILRKFDRHRGNQ